MQSISIYNITCLGQNVGPVLWWQTVPLIYPNLKPKLIIRKIVYINTFVRKIFNKCCQLGIIQRIYISFSKKWKKQLENCLGWLSWRRLPDSFFFHCQAYLSLRDNWLLGCYFNPAANNNQFIAKAVKINFQTTYLSDFLKVFLLLNA